MTPMAARQPSTASALLRRRFPALAAALTLVVLAGTALLMLPLREADGRYDKNPYGLLNALENRALDLLFQLRDARRADARARGLGEPITIVAVDEESIRASRVRLQRWPRDWYARLVTRAREGGARVVGLDLYLSEKGGDYPDGGDPEDALPDKDRAADLALADAIYETENVVLAQKLAAGGVPAILPHEMFAEGATAVAFVDFPHDGDQSVRAAQPVITQPGAAPQLSFAAALAQLYTDETLEPDGDSAVRLGARRLPLRNDGTLQIDFRGRTPSFRTVSAGDILFKDDAGVPDELFRDRIVIIGATNNDAPDLFLTPFYEPFALARLFDRALPSVPARMPGVEVHANATATLINGRALARPSYFGQLLFVLAALAVVAFAVFRLRALFGVALVVAVAVLLLFVSAWAFDARGLVLPLASAWAGVALLAPLGFLLRQAHERALREEKEAERAQIMDIFSRCVSQEVAEELWRKRDRVELGGEARVVTVIFTDIRNFTTLTEAANSSKEVVAWLNDYFGRMQETVAAHGGHINKYIGDGLMIVFGAPVDRGAAVEARAAVECSLRMLEEVERLNREWEGTGRPVIAIGVGVHTGEATCGVIGSPGRLEYSLIGDTVNLAARLEGTTKEAGVSLVVSHATAALLGDAYEAEPLGDVRVKGKTESTAVYTVRRRQTAAVQTHRGGAEGAEVARRTCLDPPRPLRLRGEPWRVRRHRKMRPAVRSVAAVQGFRRKGFSLMSSTHARATRAALILLAFCALAADAHARQPAPQQKPTPAQTRPRPPKKKIQASANFAQYAGRDASNRLIAGGATRDILTEAERHNREGREAYDAGRYGEAVEAFRQLTELRPDSAIAFYSLGVAHEAAGRGKEAAAAYRKAAELTNDTALEAVSLYNLANVHAAAGEPREAIEAYRKVLALVPRESVAHYNLGLAHAAAGQLTEAVNAFRQAVALKDDFADAHFNLGITLGRLERYAEAAEAFRAAVRLKPEHAEARFNLGLVHLALEDGAAAQGEIEALRKLNPELAAKLKSLSN
jgi:adenylate cyclase